MIGGVLAVLVLIVILVVGVTASWIIINPNGDEPAPAVETTTTQLGSTSTTESTTTSTSTTESTSTSTSSTSTTRPPSWVCDKTLTRTETVVTRCQSQTPGASVGGKRENNNTQVTADVVYELANALGGYSDFQAKVEGPECIYQMSKVTMKFSQLMSCEKPRNLTKITNATMKK